MRVMLLAMVVAMTPACMPEPDPVNAIDAGACPDVVDAGPVPDARPHYWDECLLWCGARSLCDSFDLGSAHVCHAGCVGAPETLEYEPCPGGCQALADAGGVP